MTVVPLGIFDTLHAKTARLPTITETSLPVTFGSGTVTKKKS